MTEENQINKAYEAIEIASKTGKIKKGTNEVTKAIERGAAKLVLAAADTNPAEVIMHLEPLCKEKETLFVKVPSREELGAAASLSVSTSSVAIVEAGDAAPVLKELATLQQQAAAPKAEEKKPEEKQKVAEKPKEETPAETKEAPAKEEKKAEEKPKEEAKETVEEKKEE